MWGGGLAGFSSSAFPERLFFFFPLPLARLSAGSGVRRHLAPSVSPLHHPCGCPQLQSASPPPLPPLSPLFSRQKKERKSLLSGNFAVRVELERCSVTEVFQGLERGLKVFPTPRSRSRVAGSRGRRADRCQVPPMGLRRFSKLLFSCVACVARLFSPLASTPAAPAVSPRLKTHLSV